jgi:hypothetical protein
MRKITHVKIKRKSNVRNYVRKIKIKNNKQKCFDRQYSFNVRSDFFQIKFMLKVNPNRKTNMIILVSNIHGSNLLMLSKKN